MATATLATLSPCVQDAPLRSCALKNAYSSTFRSGPAVVPNGHSSMKLFLYAPRCESVRIVRAAQRGTIRFRSKKDDNEDEGSKKVAFGTQIFRLGKKPEEEKEVEVEEKAQVGLIKFPNLSGLQVFQRGRQSDPNTVFVAGATGQTGARVTLELLHAGFRVRAGVPDLLEAQKLAETAAAYGLITKEEFKQLNVVEYKPSDTELTAKALGNASKVVITVGLSENGPSGEITNANALTVIQAAELAKASNVILITSDSTDSVQIQSPANIFQRLFSLFKSARASGLSTEALIEKIAETDLNFTVIKASSGISDNAAPSSGIVVYEEGKAEPGKISKLQVAELVAQALSNVEASSNKVVEAVATEGISQKPIADAFNDIPLDGRRQAIADKKAKLLAEEKERIARETAFAEAEAAAAEARAAAKLLKVLEGEAKQLEAEEARVAAVAAKASAEADEATISLQGIEQKVKEIESFIPKSGVPKFFDISEIAPKIKTVSSAVQSQKLSFSKLTEGFDLAAFTSQITPKEKKAPAAPKKKAEAPEKSTIKFSFPTKSEPPAPKPQKKRPTIKPKVEKPPPPPVARVDKPVEKRKALGGLFEQDIIYED